MTPRVAVVVSQLGFGGAERQTAALLAALKGRPFEPRLVACLSSDLEPYGPPLVEQGYRLEVLPRGGSFDLARLARLRRLLHEERIELVHAVHLLASGYAWLAAWPGRSPVVLPTVRGAEAGPGALRRLVYRRMLRSCPRALVNSSRGARFMQEVLGAPAGRIAVVPNGVDFAALAASAQPAALRRELGIPPEAPLVAYVGKDSRVKNVPRAVEVVRRTLGALPELRAVFAGGGLDEEARGRLAPDLAPDRLRLLGPRRDVPSILAAADALLLTSDSEGCPNVVIEALGLGTPVVSADVGDVAAIVGTAGAGAVVPRGEIDAYAAALGRLLADRAAAREAVRRELPRLEAGYGLAAMVEGTLAIWRELLARAPARTP
ncbi:MAG: glycosyltransferase family 4 protein [Acidobacteria bacterium]|nr:glycosyltransferase family 4 protein [Acidobacteriota bacterium]